MTARGQQADPPMTPPEQDAFDRVVSLFPEAKLGRREPHDPLSELQYQRLVAEQSTQFRPAQGYMAGGSSGCSSRYRPAGTSG